MVTVLLIIELFSGPLEECSQAHCVAMTLAGYGTRITECLHAELALKPSFALKLTMIIMQA